MDLNTVKIVADSSADILALDGVEFASAPLKIITKEKEYTDNENLDVVAMVNELLKYKGKSSTACPNHDDWIAAFGDAKYIFCITITSALSGSYNSACIAKQTYEETYPDRHVFVIDSLSAGPELMLITEKLREYILSGERFEAMCENIAEYMKKTKLVFMLESMRNLANNGRVNPIAAKAAGFLGIRAIGRASDKGTLELLDKCRGEQKSLSVIAERLGENIRKIRIAHCCNEPLAKSLEELLVSRIKDVDVKIYPCRGLCSFYAEKGGILIGVEQN